MGGSPCLDPSPTTLKKTKALYSKRPRHHLQSFNPCSLRGTAPRPRALSKALSHAGFVRKTNHSTTIAAVGALTLTGSHSRTRVFAVCIPPRDPKTLSCTSRCQIPIRTQVVLGKENSCRCKELRHGSVKQWRRHPPSRCHHLYFPLPRGRI